MRKSCGQSVASALLVCEEICQLRTTNVLMFLKPVRNCAENTLSFAQLHRALIHPIFDVFTEVNKVVIPIIHSTYKENNKVYIKNFYSNKGVA